MSRKKGTNVTKESAGSYGEAGNALLKSESPSGDDGSECLYTYGDYLKFPDEFRCEIIDGVLYDMTPAPNRDHQKILVELVFQFHRFLKGKPCEVLCAPFDVRLPRADEPDEEIRTVVQPDLLVICDKSKIDKRGLRCGPDLAIEILSPSTASKDCIKKRGLYEHHGVREFWIVDPAHTTISIYRLSNEGVYGKPDIYDRKSRIAVQILPGLDIIAADVFASIIAE
ncbi:MAG: Uma2 family endonuclease [Candidatus Riflebacteria bacterium]|nr:Uma2 family endonuclease [Candidatus Riflebacteria bacterium]